ncbi:MAG: hypothetical protein IJX39_08770 [Clostridia bacterium]|nr:hypothetical protein [Clostridia bacterium]
MTELNETAEKNATAMTGKEKPSFKSATERHRTIHENYMGTMVRFKQADNFMQGEMLELMREGVSLLRQLVKEGDNGEQ